MQVHKATLSDLGGLTKLLDAFIAEHRVYAQEVNRDVAIRTLVGCVDGHLVLKLVNEKEEIIGGFAGLIVPALITKDTICQELMLYVYPDYRKHVKLFLEYIEAVCVKLGVTQLIIADPTEDQGLAKFLQLNGFTRLETQMTKNLRRPKV